MIFIEKSCLVHLSHAITKIAEALRKPSNHPKILAEWHWIVEW
jgi:hypothetical protein